MKRLAIIALAAALAISVPAIAELENSRIAETEVVDSGIETIDYRKYLYVTFKSKAVEKEKWEPVAIESLNSVRILKR